MFFSALFTTTQKLWISSELLREPLRIFPELFNSFGDNSLLRTYLVGCFFFSSLFVWCYFQPEDQGSILPPCSSFRQPAVSVSLSRLACSIRLLHLLDPEVKAGIKKTSKDLIKKFFLNLLLSLRRKHLLISLYQTFLQYFA